MTASLLLAFAAAVPAAPPAAETKVLAGKVLPTAAALKAVGVTADKDAAGVALVTADGAVYPLVKDEASRLLFLDPQVQNRPVRLSGRLIPGGGLFRVDRVQTVKD